jgi:hypothetical protein
MASIRSRLSLKFLLPLLLIATFSVASFAATVSVTTVTYQDEHGVYYNVAGGFTAAGNAFAVVQASGAATTLPAAWANAGTVQTALTAGHWYYSVTITINAGAATSTMYTVTVTWNTGSGYSTLGSALTFTSPGSITPGQTMTFLFDTGGSSFSAPTGIVITVA